MTHAPSVSVYSYGGRGPGWLGATHGEELMFVFGYPFIPEVAAVRNELKDEEKALSVKFMEFWTNFAKTGNPGHQTPGSLPETERDFWPVFSIPELEHKDLSLNLTTGRALKANECHFWNNYVIQLATMLSDLEVTERQWRQAFSTWKNVDMSDWRKHFNQFKSNDLN